MKFFLHTGAAAAFIAGFDGSPREMAHAPSGCWSMAIEQDGRVISGTQFTLASQDAARRCGCSGRVVEVRHAGIAGVNYALRAFLYGFYKVPFEDVGADWLLAQTFDAGTHDLHLRLGMQKVVETEGEWVSRIDRASALSLVEAYKPHWDAADKEVFAVRPEEQPDRVCPVPLFVFA